MRKVKEKYPASVTHKWVFTSDDMPWVKKHFKDLGDDAIFFENDADVLLQLWVGTQCDNNIISNSTFAWWSAYLNPNKEKIVIYPQPWFGISPKMRKQDVSCLFTNRMIPVHYAMDVSLRIKSILCIIIDIFRDYAKKHNTLHLVLRKIKHNLLK